MALAGLLYYLQMYWRTFLSDADFQPFLIFTTLPSACSALMAGANFEPKAQVIVEVGCCPISFSTFMISIFVASFFIVSLPCV